MIASAARFRGQERLLALLERYLAQGRISGTLLLLGQRGLGKTTLAGIIARALCCETNQPRPGRPAPQLTFCGECYACRSIISGNQSEFVCIRPKGQDIKVEQIDEGLDGLRSASLHPVNLPWRIFLIDDAHFLNDKTANQLLKLLEEPPARTLFILTTDQPDKLIPTIRSRGVPFSLQALPRWQLEEFIRHDNPEVAARAVREAARMAGGRYVDALGLAHNDPWRDAVCSMARALAQGRNVPECATELQKFEFDLLWAKELQDSGLEEDDALKLLEKSRINELRRQALALAYDRGNWQLLADASRGLDYYPKQDRRGPHPEFPVAKLGHSLAILKARIHSNVDPMLAQVAFESSL
jgi:hypothetical protein